MSHFDLPGPRYAVAKAQNGNFGDSSLAVWPAMQAKSVKMVKTFHPGSITLVAWWRAQKIYISSTQAKVMGDQSQKYQKMMQKCQIWLQICHLSEILV